MDILSIRKKARGGTTPTTTPGAATPAAAPTPATSTSSSAPPTDPGAVTPPRAMAASAPTPPPQAPSSSSSSSPASSPPASSTSSPRGPSSPPPGDLSAGSSDVRAPASATNPDSPLVASADRPSSSAPALPAASPSTSAATRPTAAHDPLAGFLASDDTDLVGGVDVEAVAAPRDAADASRYLGFRLGNEDYAVSIMDVREILTIRSLTEVPRAPREILGVVSKRGVVLPVIELATCLGLRDPDRRIRPRQRVLVVGEGDRACGLRVDAVSEVVKLSRGDIESVPPSLGQKNAGLLIGLGRVDARLFILLDVNAVLDALAVAVGIAPASRGERAL